MQKKLWLGATWSVLTGAALLRAQEPLNAPSPLVGARAAEVSAGTLAMTRTAADRAFESGLSSQAADLYRQLLAMRGADRAEVTLALATALLESGRPDEADKALAGLAEGRNAAWHLRAGLVAIQLKKYEAAKAELATIKESELPPSDYPWWWFFQGAMVDITSPGEVGRANDFYVRAEYAEGNSDMAKARFQLAAEEMRLRRGVPPTPVILKAAKDNADRYLGQGVGYDWARQYVLMLLAVDQRDAAMTFLQTFLPTIPAGEKSRWDEFRLMVGLIGDRGRSFAGRKALTELLENGNDPKRQRQALQLLWNASQAEPARGQFRVALDRMTGVGSKHRILEDILYYRAQLALVEKKYDDATGKANELLEKFPGSPLRVHAYGLLTQLAWEQRRYRGVAAAARKARAELAEKKTPAETAARAELTLLEAEAWFRAGDFREAADAYAVALRERPPHVKPGDLMFQRELAEIKSESPDAAKVLDELERDPEFDVENRWQAEWSLARALLVQGKTAEEVQRKTAEAFARVTKLLGEKGGEAAGGVAPELRARLAWLHTKLSLDANQPLQTLTLADALLGSLANIADPLRSEIASTTILRKAEAQFRLGREASGQKAKDYETAALATLVKVRAEFPTKDAAIQSFLIEAEHYEDSDRIQEAQQTLTRLAENQNPEYKDSIFTPYAFYRLALLSERLGQTKDYQEANRWIEALVERVNKSPKAAAQGDLLFAARLKQGELLRRLNEFAPAQQVYDELTRKPASLENGIIAELELARSYNAQSANDEAQADRAQLWFEKLCYRVDASPDVRVEAGYNLGLLLRRRGKLDEAARVWWRDVITPFLPREKQHAELGATRPYWLARTLNDLGALYETQGKLEEARNVYTLMANSNLGYTDTLAKLGLQRLPEAPAK